MKKSGGTPVAGTTVTVDQGAQSFYDGADAAIWDTDSTGPAGIAWLPNNTAGSHNLIVTPGAVVVQEVFADAITVITIVP